MMNPFLLSSKERLADWKLLRNDLPNHSETSQLQLVANYWAHAPLVNIAYDPESPETWGTPWEMISRNDWCENSLAIGMEFTLRLSGWNSERLSLIYLRNTDDQIEKLVLSIDDEYLLNYYHSSVTNYPTKPTVISRFKFVGKKYIRME